ncbi:MAG: SPOR domain-containing protein [Formivibrio sp.]|nr:SPOR domain-containing protein [Formivibrio sp.]
MTQSNVSEELLYIRKRARRRLLGAIALVVFALVVLWTVLDNAPPPQFTAGHPVEITSSVSALATNASVVAVVQTGNSAEIASAPGNVSASGSSAVAAVPLSTAVASQSAKEGLHAPAASSSATILPGKLVNYQTPVKVAPVVKPKHASAMVVKPALDPRKILDGVDEKKTASTAKSGRFFLQVGAFADEAKSAQLLAKLKAAGLPAFGEKVHTTKGELTRIRVGPSADEARANEWRRKSEAAGVSGKVIKQ